MKPTNQVINDARKVAAVLNRCVRQQTAHIDYHDQRIPVTFRCLLNAEHSGDCEFDEGDMTLERAMALVAEEMERHRDFPFDVMQLIDLNALCARPEIAADVPRNELPGERARAAACLAAIDSVIASAPEPGAKVEDCWLSPAEVENAYPTLKRRWLFANADRLSFVRRLSRKRLLVNEAGLKRWLSGRKAH